MQTNLANRIEPVHEGRAFDLLARDSEPVAAELVGTQTVRKLVWIDDAEIVTRMMSFAVDPANFADLIDTWHARLSHAGYAPGALDDCNALRSHFEALRLVVTALELPPIDDPVDRFIQTSTGAAMVVNRAFQVVAINAQGRELFGIEQGQLGKLHWVDPAFRDRVYRVVAQRGSAGPGFMAIRIALPDLQSALAELCPVPGTMPADGLIGIRTLDLKWALAGEAFLGEAFGLTTAEIEICRLLYQGLRIEEIRERRSVSMATVRTQLHTIFQKTETASQVELILLLAKLGAPSFTPPPRRNRHWSDPLGREGIATRPDGIRVAHSWMGDPEGTPVLLVHGGMHGYLFPEAFEMTLVQRKVRLVVPSRPGFGHSERNDALDCGADLERSLAFLCSHFSLPQLPVVALHTAIPPVARLAASPENPFSSVIGVGDISGYGEVESRDAAPQARVFDWFDRHAPWIRDMICRIAFRHFQNRPAIDFLRQHYAHRVLRFAGLEQTELAALIRNAADFISAKGYRASMEDEALRTVDPKPAIAAMEIPFHAILGELSGQAANRTATPPEPSGMERLAASGLFASFRQVEQAGFFVPYENPAGFANAIADAVATLG